MGFLKSFAALSFVLITAGSIVAFDDSYLAGELVNIARANSRAWKKYDCLIVESSFFRNDPGNSKSKPKALEYSIRLAFDFEEKEFFCFSRWQSMDEPDNGKLLNEVIVKSKSCSRWMRYPQKSRPFGSDILSMILGRSYVPIPEPKLVGIQIYPCTDNFDEFDNQWGEATGKSPDYVSVSRSKESILIATKHLGSSSIEEYDALSLMKTRTYIRMEDGRIPLDQNISWIEKDGIYLPSQIISEKYDFEDKSTRYTTTTILWRSINEKLDRSLFDPKTIDDLSKAIKLVDEEAFKDGGCLNLESE